jgi:hypothetical protein
VSDPFYDIGQISSRNFNWLSFTPLWSPFLHIESSKDVTRMSCNARVQFSVSCEGVWTVQKVVLDHSHYLASSNKSHKLRSQRHVIEANRMLISQVREAGLKPSQVYV